MNQLTQQKFGELCAAMARGYGVATVEKQFSVEPTVQQRLQDKIVEQSAFLQKINVVTVDELSGENVLGGVTGPVSGRTDTSVEGHERSPRDVLGLEKYGYLLHQTNSDVAIRYATLDAWAKFPDFQERYARWVQERIANDRELVGWYGENAAKDTDLQANPMLQDVNRGWLQYMRDNLPANILTEGGNAEEIRIGEGGDFANLDLAVNDLLQGIPRYLRKDLVVLVGDELVARDRAALYKAVAGTPSEKALFATAMATFGGLPWETPTNFPGRGLVITSFDNLSIYEQAGTWRRRVEDTPKKDRVEDYNSRNEGYVVECPEKFVAVESANVRLPDGAGWA